MSGDSLAVGGQKLSPAGTMHMAWDKLRRDSILAVVRANDDASCPPDGAALRVRWGPAVGRSRSIAIRRPTRGADAGTGRADDPLGGGPRGRTDAERRKLVGDARAAGSVTCPVDGAAIGPVIAAGGGAVSI